MFDTMPDVSDLETPEEIITYFYEYLALIQVELDGRELGLFNDILSMNKDYRGLRFVYVDDILELMNSRTN